MKDEPVEPGAAGDLADAALAFPDAADFKPEDIKLDPNCDFGNGKLVIFKDIGLSGFICFWVNRSWFSYVH